VVLLDSSVRSRADAHHADVFGLIACQRQHKTPRMHGLPNVEGVMQHRPPPVPSNVDVKEKEDKKRSSRREDGNDRTLFRRFGDVADKALLEVVIEHRLSRPTKSIAWAKVFVAFMKHPRLVVIMADLERDGVIEKVDAECVRRRFKYSFQSSNASQHGELQKELAKHKLLPSKPNSGHVFERTQNKLRKIGLATDELNESLRKPANVVASVVEHSKVSERVAVSMNVPESVENVFGLSSDVDFSWFDGDVDRCNNLETSAAPESVDNVRDLPSYMDFSWPDGVDVDLFNNLETSAAPSGRAYKVRISDSVDTETENLEPGEVCALSLDETYGVVLTRNRGEGDFICWVVVGDPTDSRLEKGKMRIKDKDGMFALAMFVGVAPVARTHVQDHRRGELLVKEGKVIGIHLGNRKVFVWMSAQDGRLLNVGLIPAAIEERREGGFSDSE
jgi:hypothetical protein